MTKRFLMAVSCAVFAVSTVTAQEARSPKPADNGPSLETTMKFIEDKLNEQDALHFAVYTHDNGSGQDSAAEWSFDLTNFHFDSAKCLLGGHFKSTFSADGGTAKQRGANSEGDSVHAVQAIKKVLVVPAGDWWAQELANQGHPMTTAHIEPQLFVLSMGRYRHSPEDRCTRDGKQIGCPEPELIEQVGYTWIFRDEDTADRVAKALVHAIELCGRGSQPEPF